MALPITLTPACHDGWSQLRSGFTWLVADGEQCRAGKAIARCTFTFFAPPLKWPDQNESLQIVIVANCDGIVRHSQESTEGGWRDLLENHPYKAGDVIGEIIPDDAGVTSANICLMIYNRRMIGLVDDRDSLWAGWHFRQRVWRLGNAAPRQTMLSLGICELSHALRGADRAYSEFLNQFSEPVHLVARDDVPLATTARIALEQLTRTEEESALIWSDLQSSLLNSGVSFTPDDLMIAGCFGSMLADRVISERFPLLSAEGLTMAKPADYVILSMMVESRFQLRHKRLGYHIHLHRWVFFRLTPVIKEWLKNNFEMVKVSIDEIERDYVALSQKLRSAGRRLCLLNNVASRSSERIERYIHFKAPIEDHIASVRSLTLNLVAGRLAASEGVLVIDVDALATELGIGYQSPDGVHHGVRLEHEIRIALATQIERGE